MSIYERLKPEALKNWLDYNKDYPTALERDVFELKENYSWLNLKVSLAYDLCRSNKIDFTLSTLKSLFQ